MILTVFTPVYNRGHLIGRVYESLKRQKCTDFEWLVINDGSIDSTDATIRKIIREHDGLFPIRYISRENKGLMRTINQALDMAEGQLFCRLDSDDFATDDLVDTIINNWPLICEKSDICSIAFLSQNEKGEIIGYHPFKDITKCNFLDYRSRYGGQGDRNEVMKTEIFRKYKFPEIPGEKFCPEGLVWNRIARKYDALYIPKAIYVKDSTDDSITANIYNCLKSNANGVTLYYSEIVNDKTQPIKYRWINAIKYFRYSIFSQRSSHSDISLGFILMAWPAGVLVRLYDLIRNRI